MDSPVRAASTEQLRAGDLLIDCGRRRVTRNGTEIALPRLSFELLVALARAYPVMLSTEELMQRVWTPAVVNPATVGHRVQLLRQSLGDDPAHPRYVLGVRGRGYRMAAPVTPLDPDAHDPPAAGQAATGAGGSAAATAAGPPAAHPRRYWWAAAIATALVLCVLVPLRLHLPAPVPATPSQAADTRSLAVLPFADLSEHHDQGYFADALSEELINRLTAVPGLHVAARSSSFAFKGRQATVAEIARSLRVTNLLEGSVRQSGHTLRITTELVRAGSGEQVWSETFDRPLTDLFRIQDEIAGAVAQALNLSIVNRRPLKREPTQDIEAYTLYLRSAANIIGNTASDYDAAIQQLRTAVRLDPQFADAWAMLAMATVWQFEGHGPRSAEGCTQARAAADQALKLNSELEEAHRAAALVYQDCDENLSAAEAELGRALEVEPGSDDALRTYAYLMIATGRFQQALELARRAIGKDPFNPWNFAAAGDAAWALGHAEDAGAYYKKAVELQPASAGLHTPLANLLLALHRPAEAITEAEQEPDRGWRGMTLALALDQAGRRAEADRALAAYERDFGARDPGEVAVLYACRGDADRAITWLRKFAANQSGEFSSLPNRMACFDKIASDPRYVLLLRQMRQQDAGRTLAAK